MSSSPRNAYLALIAGAFLVMSLVAWALFRSLNAPVESHLPVVSTTTTAPPPEHVQDAEHAAVPRLSVDELRQKMERGEVTLIDVRDADSFRSSHIAGAVHIPLASVEAQIQYLPKDKPIVTYCT